MSFDKARLADRFGRAADTYNQAAQVQFRAGFDLIQQLASLRSGEMTLGRHTPKSACGRSSTWGDVLDLGCGTGQLIPYLRDALSVNNVLGIDISPAMIEKARQDVADDAVRFLCADIEALPINECNHYSLIWSNYALQWCHSVGVVFELLYQLNQPGGYIALTVPGLGTFAEIKQAWQSVDGAVHVNQFLALEQWQQALVDAGYALVWANRNVESEFYATPESALKAIRLSGVANVNKQRNQQLLGKNKFQQFKKAYQLFAKSSKQGEQYPLTYETYSIIAFKQ